MSDAQNYYNVIKCVLSKLNIFLLEWVVYDFNIVTL